MTLGQRLTAERNSRKPKLTQLQLAHAAGCDPSTISRIERGEQKPSVDLIQALARALDVPFLELAETAAANEPAATVAPLSAKRERSRPTRKAS